MTAPLMSVAVPAYNHARYIVACLESVVAQGYPEIEIVVVDDGSADATAELAEDFLTRHAARFRRVRVIRQANLGVSAASNRAIQECEGEWVHLLGSDDRLYPDKIAVQWQAIQSWGEADLALVYADADFIDDNDQILSSTTERRPPAGVDRSAWTWLMHTNRIPNPTVAIRRRAFLALGGFDERLRLEDLDAWLRLAARHPIARVPEILAAYRRHAGNASLAQVRMLAATWATLARFVQSGSARIDPGALRRALIRHLRRSLRLARKVDPGHGPRILFDLMQTALGRVDAGLFQRYAEWSAGLDAAQDALHRQAA